MDLDESQQQQPVEELCGWLEKGVTRKKRWITVTPSRITWCADNDPKSATKALALTDAQLKALDEGKGFRLETREKSVSFYGKDEEELQKWMGVLSNNISKLVFQNIVSIPDQTYIQDSTNYKHMLDIYTPTNISPSSGLLPVVIHVHGGGWIRGDRKRYFYGAPFMARGYASMGYVSVAVSYRLREKHPASCLDVANAVAWVWRNIHKYHGDANRIVLSGHSAGGHIVSLLSTDPTYLNSLSLDTNIIKGVISISGIYTLKNPMGSPTCECNLRNWFFRKMYSDRTFGKSHDELDAASPIIKIGTSAFLPPILLMNATSDFGLEFDGQRMWTKLQEIRANGQYQVIPATNHATVTRSFDTLAVAVAFIRKTLSSTSTPQS